MNLRTKSHALCWGSAFNLMSFTEVLVYYDDGDWDSVPFSDLEVKIGKDWVDLKTAYERRLVIPNNDNTHFGLPKNEEAKARGYND